MTRGAKYLLDTQVFGKFIPRVYTDKITLEGNLLADNNLIVKLKVAVRDRMDKLGNRLVTDNTSRYLDNIVVDVVVMQSATWAEKIISGEIGFYRAIQEIENHHGTGMTFEYAFVPGATEMETTPLSEEMDASWPVGKHIAIPLSDFVYSGEGFHTPEEVTVVESGGTEVREELHFSYEVQMEFPGDTASTPPTDLPFTEVEMISIPEAMESYLSDYLGTFPDDLYVFCCARISTDETIDTGDIDFAEMGLDADSKQGFFNGFSEHLYGDISYDRIIKNGNKYFEQPFYFTADGVLWAGPVILARNGRYYKAEKLTNEMIIEDIENGLSEDAAAMSTPTGDIDELGQLYLSAITEVMEQDAASPDLLNNLKSLLLTMTTRDVTTMAGSVYNSLSAIVRSYTSIANSLTTDDRVYVKTVRNGKVRDARSGWQHSEPLEIDRPSRGNMWSKNYVSAHIPWDATTRDQLSWTGDETPYWAENTEGSSATAKNLLRHRSVSVMRIINEENIIYYSVDRDHRPYIPKLIQLFGFQYVKGHCYVSEVEINRRHSETWSDVVNEHGQPSYNGFYFRKTDTGAFGGKYTEYEKGNVYEEGLEMKPCVRARLYSPSLTSVIFSEVPGSEEAATEGGTIDTEGATTYDDAASLLQRTGQIYLNPQIIEPAPNPEIQTTAGGETYFGIGVMVPADAPTDPDDPTPPDELPSVPGTPYDSLRDALRTYEYSEFLQNLPSSGEGITPVSERTEYGHYGSGIYFEATPLNLPGDTDTETDPRRLMLYFNEPVIGMMQTENEITPPEEPVVAYENTLYVMEAVGLIFRDIWWQASNAMIGLSLYKDICETRCAADAASDFNEWFGEAWYSGEIIANAGWSADTLDLPTSSGFDPEDPTTWPWTKAAASYVLMMDVLGDHFAGDFGLMQEEVKAICDRISPAGGSLEHLELFYDEYADLLTTFFDKFKGTNVDISFLGEGFEDVTYWDFYVDPTSVTEIDMPAFTTSSTAIDSDELVDLSTAFDAFETIYQRNKDREHEEAISEWLQSDDAIAGTLEAPDHETWAALERGIIAFIRGSPSEGYETGLWETEATEISEAGSIETTEYREHTRGIRNYPDGWTGSGGHTVVSSGTDGWVNSEWYFSFLQFYQNLWIHFMNDRIQTYETDDTIYHRNWSSVMKYPGLDPDADILNIVGASGAYHLYLGSSGDYTTSNLQHRSSVDKHMIMNVVHWMCDDYVKLPPQTQDSFNSYKRSVLRRWQDIMYNLSNAWEDAMAKYLYGSNNEENREKVREKYGFSGNIFVDGGRLGDYIWPNGSSSWLLGNLGYNTQYTTTGCVSDGDNTVAPATTNSSKISKLHSLNQYWRMWMAIIEDLQSQGVWPVPREIIDAYKDPSNKFGKVLMGAARRRSL